MSLRNAVWGEIFIRLFKGERGRRPGRKRRGASANTGRKWHVPACHGGGDHSPPGPTPGCQGVPGTSKHPSPEGPRCPSFPWKGRRAAEGVGALRVRAAACSQLILSEQGHREPQTLGHELVPAGAFRQDQEVLR